MSRPGLTIERLTALFALGAILLTPPFLGIFNRPSMAWGIPLLYLYLFLAWGLLIAIAALVMERSSEESEKPGGAVEAEPQRSDATPDGPV